MINPFVGKNSKFDVEVVAPKQPDSDGPIMNFNFSSSKWFTPR